MKPTHASPRAKKSTNVRPIERPWLRRAIRLFAGIAPPVASRLAETLFCLPPPRSTRRDDLSSGRLLEVRAVGRRVRARRFGSGPAVLLVHGWGGRAGHLRAFVAPLVAAGLEVVALDAPGHGESGGRLSSLVHFRDAIEAVIAAVGPSRGIVAHSLGAAATTMALARGLPVERAVLVGAPAEASRYLDLFCSVLGIEGGLRARVRRGLERRFRLRFEDLSTPRLAARLAPPALVVHDVEDAEVSFEDGEAIAAAWPSAELIPTRGLGHHRILRDRSVVEAAVRFLAEPSAEAELDRELFDRDARRQLAFG